VRAEPVAEWLDSVTEMDLLGEGTWAHPETGALTLMTERHHAVDAIELVKWTGTCSRVPDAEPSAADRTGPGAVGRVAVAGVGDVGHRRPHGRSARRAVRGKRLARRRSARRPLEVVDDRTAAGLLGGWTQRRRNTKRNKKKKKKKRDEEEEEEEEEKKKKKKKKRGGGALDRQRLSSRALWSPGSPRTQVQ
jgi:hypothetical protein